MSEGNWTEDELAYDGSSEPMRRELTPRERDILTRILDDICHAILLEATGTVLPDPPIMVSQEHIYKALGFRKLSNGGIRMNTSELNTIFELRHVITPRND